MSKMQNNFLFISKSEKLKINYERNKILLEGYELAKKDRKGSEFLREKAKELEMQECSLRNMITSFRKNHKEIIQKEN